MTSVVVANVPHFLSPNQAEEDLELALVLGRVALLCEMDKSNDAALTTAIRGVGRSVRVWFRKRRTQVIVPADMRAAGVYRRLVPAWAQNPHRGAAIVDDLDERTRYVALHAPNGKRNTARSPLFRAVQTRNWNRYEAKMRRRVTRWVEEEGWNVVAGGDLNDLHGMDLHKTQVVAEHDGLMWLIVIPAAGNTVRVQDPQTVSGNHGDHPQIRAEITFKEKTR